MVEIITLRSIKDARVELGEDLRVHGTWVKEKYKGTEAQDVTNQGI